MDLSFRVSQHTAAKLNLHKSYVLLETAVTSPDFKEVVTSTSISK